VDLGDGEEAGRYASGVRRFEFDSQLAPYDFSRWPAWRALSDAITPADLQRLTPARANAPFSFFIGARGPPAAAAPSPPTRAPPHHPQPPPH